MKNTIIIYDQLLEQPILFFNLPGDYSHLNDTYINGDAEAEAIDELYDLLYDSVSAEFKHQNLTEFPTHLVSQDTTVIVCGFLP